MFHSPGRILLQLWEKPDSQPCKGPEVKGIWDAFQENLQEYLQLDHAEVPPAEVDRPVGDVFYLPMHGVTKESSNTTS